VLVLSSHFSLTGSKAKVVYRMSPGEYTTSTGQKVEQPMCTGEEGYTYF
jgi:hypothetical protein